MTDWHKAQYAAREWCGGVSTKTLYRAVRNGELKAARIGAGRNLLFCRDWCEDWLQWCATRPRHDAAVTTNESFASVRAMRDRRRA
jgi:excisionase family DNA binding protein